MKIFLLLFFFTPFFTAHASLTEAEIREAIQEFASQRHSGSSDPLWNRLGSESLPVIRKMYVESQNIVEKTLLIEGLSRFNDLNTGNFLKNEVESSTSNEVMRKKLLSAVIRSQGESAFDFVEPYLKDSDPHVRMAVATGLKSFTQNEKIQQRLNQFRKAEKKPWVLAGLDRAPVNTDLQRPRKSDSPAAQNPPAGSAQKTSGLKPLLEQEWAGTWKGYLYRAGTPLAVDAALSLVDPSAKALSWKVSLSLPKKVKQEWRTGEFTVHYFMTNLSHWIELRHPKLDVVFIAQKKDAK